jgi:hypothetical protein
MEQSEVKLFFKVNRYSVEYEDSKRRITESQGKESWLFNKLFHHLLGEIDENHTHTHKRKLSARLVEVRGETQIRGLPNTRQERLPQMCKTVAINWSIRLMGRSQWPRGLTYELSSTARKLGSWVRIPLEAWMSNVCVYSEFVLSCV